MKRHLWARFWAAAAIAAVVWLYGWTAGAVGGLGPPAKVSPPNDYYNHLVAGFVGGHLYMDLPVSKQLEALADPYDPRQNQPYRLTDTSYYRGHYYLYFGATPAVTLLLPFRLLTGLFLPTPWAILIFTSIGFISLALTFVALRERYFPDAPPWTAPAGVLMLGIGSMVDVLLRRPFFWELATAGGFAFAMLALGAVYHAMHTARRRAGWMAAAGVLLGLAVASRPTYVFAVPMLALPLLVWAQLEGIGRKWWTSALASGAGIGAIGIATFAYNYARFHNGLEFGHNYLLSVAYESKVRLFGWDHFWFNVRMYFWHAGHWSWHPPFFAPVPVPRSAMPRGFYTVDDPYGLLRVFPITLLALAAPLAMRCRVGEERIRLRSTLFAVAVLFASAAVVILLYVATIPRYAVDFLPALLLLAAIGLLSAVRILQRMPRGAIVHVALGIVALASIATGSVTIFDLGRLVSHTHPDAMARITAVTSRLELLQDRMRGVHYGPVKLQVMFRKPAGYGDPALQETSKAAAVGRDRPIPPDRGVVETLLTAGDPAHPDRVLVEQTSARQVRLGIQHADAPPQWSPMLQVDPSAVHNVQVELGSFYPELEHGLFAHAGYAKASWLLHRAEIQLDGRDVLRTFGPFDSGRRGAPRRASPGFTARVTSFALVPPALSTRRIDVPDNRYLVFTTPSATTIAARYPLLWAGKGASADLLFLEVKPNGRGRLGYAHGSDTPVWSGDFAAAAGSRHALELRQTERGWAEPNTGPRLLVAWMDHQLVCDQPVAAFPAATNEIVVGRNPTGLAGATAAFPGGLETHPGPPSPRPPGGTLLLRVIMPKGVKNAWIPLLCTGHTGAADTLSIDYMSRDEIQFRFDHWAAPLVMGPPVPVDENVGHDLEITYPSFAPAHFGQPAHGDVVVRLDGKEVLRTTADTYGFVPNEFYLGENHARSTLDDYYFRGAFIQRDWVQKRGE